MTDRARERIRVAADVARCFAVATDFTGYPRWAHDVKEVEVRERDAHGRGTRVAYRVAAIGRSIRYVLDYDFADAPDSFSWTLHQSDQLRMLDGRYRFRSDGDATIVDYELAVELGVPLPGVVTRRAAGIIVRTALGDFRRTVEAPLASAGVADAPYAPEPAAPAPAVAPEPETVPFDDVGRDPSSSERRDPGPGFPSGSGWLEGLARDVLGAVPEVRDHVIVAADAALTAARAFLDAAERALDRQRGDDAS